MSDVAQATKGGYSTVKGLLTGNPEAAWEGAREWAHGLGATGGQALQLEAGRGATGPAEAERASAAAVRKGTAEVGKATGIPTSENAVALAGQHSPDIVNASKDLQIAQKDLANIDRKYPISAKGSDASFAHAVAIKNYMEDLWDTYHKGPVARNANLPIEPQTVASQARAVLTPEAVDAIGPSGDRQARNLNRWIDTKLNQPRSLSSADKMIRELNDDLEKASASASSPYGQLEIRVKQAAVNGLRDEVDRVLTSPTVGETGVRDVNQRYGALRNVLERTIKAAAGEAAAEGKSPTFPPWMHAYTFVHPTPEGVAASMGAGIHPSGMFKPTASKQLSKGMSALGSSRLGLPPPPEGFPVGPGQLAPPPSQGQQGQPASGPTMVEMRTLGMPPVMLTPQQQSTIDTMIRGPRWKGMEGVDKVAAINRIISGAKF